MEAKIATSMEARMEESGAGRDEYFFMRETWERYAKGAFPLEETVESRPNDNYLIRLVPFGGKSLQIYINEQRTGTAGHPESLVRYLIQYFDGKHPPEEVCAIIDGILFPFDVDE